METMMDKKPINISNSTGRKIIAVILACLPVFAPYALFGFVPLNIWVIVLGFFVMIISRKKVNFKTSLPIIVLWGIHVLLSFLSAQFAIYNASLLNSILVTSFTLVGIIYMWSNCDFETFTKFANFLGITSCILLFIQAIFIARGSEPPSGRLFSMDLLDYAGFVSTTWGFRLNSLFSEPSYFAIYILPLLALSMSKKKYKLSLLYIISLVLSSSTLGIVGAAVVIVYYLLIEEKNIKLFISILCLTLILHWVFYNTIPYYNMSVNRSFEKISMIKEGHSDNRLYGQAYLYNHLPVIKQIVGVGVNQLQNYFSNRFPNIANYSNSFIITLINTGLIGLIAYVLFIIKTITFAPKRKRLVYAIIFLLVAATDYFIYNHNFFYLLAFIYLQEETRI
ncbi:O-antigen ligase family protein [Bacillus sp. V33-4]|uniref:O-antigen ligase family protein n=1 Tax=Bacillus sp. V33-4 TaxID=2054169 RepID=UPI000C758AC7|nr:O-antigen ligase family protein [Bacillus sp. V33-4]PLR85414.1 hypothetical protein CVD23_08535 [Bacillus sp. V33-4]